MADGKKYIKTNDIYKSFVSCWSTNGWKWWRDPESNWGHKDFQSSALPTELSRLEFPPEMRGYRQNLFIQSIIEYKLRIHQDVISRRPLGYGRQASELPSTIFLLRSFCSSYKGFILFKGLYWCLYFYKVMFYLGREFFRIGVLRRDRGPL